MQNHAQGSSKGATKLRQMDKQEEETLKSYNSSYLSHGIKQIVDGVEQTVNVSQQGHDIEQYVENPSRHSHSIEQLIDNITQNDQSTNPTVGNASQPSHIIVQIPVVDNSLRHSHSIEQLIENVTQHRSTNEQPIDTVTHHSHGIEQIVEGRSQNKHGIKQSVDNVPQHSFGIQHIVAGESRQGHEIQQAVESGPRHNYGIDQIVASESRQRHRIEQIVESGSRQCHGIEQIVESGSRQSHGIEQIVKSGSRQSHGIELIVESGSRQSHGIEQIVESGSRQSHGMEQIVESGSRQSHVIELIVESGSRQSHGIEQIVESGSRQSHGIQQIIDSGPQPSHGIQQIVDNVSQPSHAITPLVESVSQQSHSQHLLTNLIFQPQHLNKDNPITLLGFPSVNTVDGQPSVRDIQGSGNVETLLNYVTSYSPIGLSTSNDYIPMQNVMLTSIDASTYAPDFNIKDTGLTMLSNLAQSRSPITAEEKSEENISNESTEVRNDSAIQIIDFGHTPDSNATQLAKSEIITNQPESNNVGGNNSHLVSYILTDKDQHNYGKQPSNEVPVDSVPYIGTENTLLCKPQTADEISIPLKRGYTISDSKGHAVCEEVYNFMDMFQCGACSLLFVTMCHMHVHMETHNTNGSYVYDKTTKTAYPKFEVVSVGIQTSSDDTEGDDDMFDLKREECSDVNTSSLTLYPSDKEPSYAASASMLGSSVPLSATSDSTCTTFSSTEADFNVIKQEEVKEKIVENEEPKEELCYGVSGTEMVNVEPNDCDDSPDYIPEVYDDIDEDQDYSPSINMPLKGSKKEVHERKRANKKEVANKSEKFQKLKKITDKSGNLKRKSSSVDDKKTTKQKKPKRQIPIVCSLCGEKFTFAFHLKTHSEKVHGVKRTFPCRSCSINFDSVEELKEHRLKHKHLVHQCEICDKVVSTAASLRDHRNFHMGVKPHECPSCGKQFRTTGQLNTHIRETHESGFSQQCEVCGKTFTSRYRMRDHTKQCQDIKPHKCEVCGKRFIRTTQLRVHQRTHTGEKPYVCDICGCALTNYSSLIKHNRIHTGEKPYKCDQCPQAFTAKTTLNDHKRIHTQDKRYVCTHCGRSFIKKWNLKTHLRQHTGETPYKCSICGQAYKQNVLLKTHMQSHNQDGIVESQTKVEVQMVNNV